MYHCPYCHGWEIRDQPVAVLGADDTAAHLALNLVRLGCDVVLCADGQLRAGGASRRALRAAGVRVCEDLVLGVAGEPDKYVRLSLSPAGPWSDGPVRAPGAAARIGSGAAARLRAAGGRCRAGERAGADDGARRVRRR